MGESLQSRLSELRQRLRQMTWLYGLSWLVAVVFGAVLLCGLLDWALHIEDPGLRLLFGLGIVASAAWIGWRLLFCPLRRQASDVEIALRIEKRFPGFNDSLASTVQFLSAGRDPRLGSPALQEQVAVKTVEQVERVNLSDIVETRRVKKMALWAVAICLLAAMVAGWNQAAAATALHRLMFPFANRPWPKANDLRLVNEKLEPLQYDLAEPLRLAEGDSVEVYVEDVNNRLPEDVRMEYRFGDEDVISEVLRRTTLRSAEGESKEVFLATIVATKGPMTFRAVGGDDFEMDEQHLDVVPPPAIKSLQLKLTPPSYISGEAETLPDGVGHVRGYVGTRVIVKAAANKPLQLANLRVKDRSPVRAKLSNNGRELEAEFVISEAGVYSWWLDLKDLEGFENPNMPRYEVRGTADLVPDVWIDEPPRDLTVTPTAMVPLLVGAKDDLGIKEIRVRYKIGDDEETPLSTISLFSGEERPTEWQVEQEWELAELKLQPGMFITFHAEAVDDCDLDGEHIGRSIARKLTIVTPEEKTAELSFQQGGLIDELETARSMQLQTHDQVEQLQIQLKTAGKFRFEDVDLLKRLEIEQRQINARLSDPKEGLTAHAAELLKELEQNKIDDPEMKQRLAGIATEIGILQEDHLPTIEQDLTNARKLAQTEHGQTPEEDPEKTPKASHDAKSAIDSADNNQQAVLDSLGELLAQLSEWRHHRDLTGEVQDAIGTQEKLNQDTAALQHKTLGKRPSQLTPQEQADLARLADRQRKQSQRVGDLGDRFDDIADELKTTSPAAAEILNDAAAHLREQAVAGRLGDSANQLGRNQIGEAVNQQRDALDALKELSDILKNRGVSDTETLVKKLKEAQNELANLRERQEELKKKTEEAKGIQNQAEREKELEKLRQEQQQIRREISSLARRLRRLQAAEAGSSLRRAAFRIEEVEKLLQENQAEEIEQEQQEVLDDLEQAERELAKEARQAEERLAREMLERIADELKSMIARQQNVIEETNRLEGLRKKAGTLKRSELKSLRNLAEDQRNLKGETDRLVEVVKAAEVFAMALRGAAREMEAAADRLEERLTDAQTVNRETTAKNRFVDLVAALEVEKKNGGENPENTGGGAAASGGPQTDGIPHLAQLKMLKSLQEDLIRRTEDLDRVQTKNGSLTDDQKLELDLLAGEQGLLADLARNLTAQVAETFEAQPEDAGAEPEKKEETKPNTTPGKKPSLEEELKKDLNLDDLLPKESGDSQTRRLESERFGTVTRIFGFAAQIEPEDQPTVEEPKSQPAEREEIKKPEPAPLPKSDEELFKELTGDEASNVNPDENPLEEAIKGMRSAQERLGKKNTDEETREIQEDVVANLQKLIDMMKNNQSKPPSSGSPQSPNQQPQEQPQNAKANPQNGNPDTKPNSVEPQTNPMNRKDPVDSSDEQRLGKNGKPLLSPRPEMVNDVWGHLPPAVRQQLLNLGSDKYLPKYEDLARRYFESLAEPASGFKMKSP